MGWSLGANDASNVIGAAVSSKMLRFWTAAILAAVFVLIGALLGGQAGIDTLQELAADTQRRVHQSRAAHQRAFTHFTWEAKARKTLEVYRWVTGERSEKPEFAEVS